MNKIHQIIWSKARQKWVVVSECCARSSPTDRQVGHVSGGLKIKWELLFLALLGWATPQWASAACTFTSGTSYVCSGVTPVSQVIGGVNSSVTTLPGFELNAVGDALTLNGAGTMSFNDANASKITSSAGTGVLGISSGHLDITTTGVVTGGASGMRTYTYGGAMNVVAKDAIIGKAGWGLYAETGAGATQMNITATSLTGSLDGIHITHAGKGDMSLIATGDITGKIEQGIDIYRYGSGYSTVDVRNVSGGVFGIYFDDLVTSTGVSITANDVSSVNAGPAIIASHEGTGDLAITTTGVVSGASHGFELSNYAKGNLIIDAQGDVTGRAGWGIYALGSANSLGMDIQAKNLTGSLDGLSAHHFGTNNMNITTTGSVTGKGEQGLEVR
ncbi:MAG: ESPR domain-containing protein, partial [Formosimonas sp.]